MRRARALPATLLLLVLTIPQIIGGWDADWLTYAAAVQRAVATGSPYAAHQLAGPFVLPDQDLGAGFVYPPTALPLLVLFPSELALSLGGVLVLWVVVWMLMRPSWWVGMILALVLAVTPPLYNTLYGGQITAYLAAAFGMMYLAPRWSGVLAVAAGMVKITPGFGLVWAIREGRWRGSLVFATAVTVAVALWIPRAIPEYLVVLGNMEPGCRTPFPSFACAGVAWAGWVLAGVLAVAAWRIRDDALAFAILGLATIPAIPDPYPNSFLIPLVAALPLIRRELQRRADYWVAIDTNRRKLELAQ